MTAPIRLLTLAVTTILASLVLLTPTATASPSCVAQSVQVEHQAYGSAWGHDLIAFLATHPEVLATFGFDTFGEYAAYAARLDHANCPPDL